VDAVELWFRQAFLRVVGWQLDPRFRFVAWFRGRLDGLDVVLRDEGSLMAIFYWRAIRRGFAVLIRGHLLLPAVLQLGTAVILAGERRIIRANSARHLSIASPKATEPDNVRPLSSVMRPVSATESLGNHQRNALLFLTAFYDIRFSTVRALLSHRKINSLVCFMSRSLFFLFTLYRLVLKWILSSAF